jgi:hypothetical protein
VRIVPLCSFITPLVWPLLGLRYVIQRTTNINN